MQTINQFQPTETTIPEGNAHYNHTQILNMPKGEIYSNTQVKKCLPENNLLHSINDFGTVNTSNNHDARSPLYFDLEYSRHYREASGDKDEENRLTSRICSRQLKLTSNNGRKVTSPSTSDKTGRKTHGFLYWARKCPLFTAVCYESSQFFYVVAKKSAVLEMSFGVFLDESEMLLKKDIAAFLRQFAKNFLDFTKQCGNTGDLFVKPDRKVTLRVFNSIFNPDLREKLQDLDKELIRELNAVSNKVSIKDMISYFIQFIVSLDPRGYLEKDELKPKDRRTCYALALIFKVGGIFLSEKLKKYANSQNLYVNLLRVMRLSTANLKLSFCTSDRKFDQSLPRNPATATPKLRNIATQKPVGPFEAAQADERPEIPAIVNALQRPDVLDPAANVNHLADIEEPIIQQLEMINLEELHAEHHAELHTELPEAQNYETERLEVPINLIFVQQEQAINVNHLGNIEELIIQQTEMINLEELHAEHHAQLYAELLEVQNYDTERQEVPITPIIEQQEENLDTADLTNMQMGDYNP